MTDNKIKKALECCIWNDGCEQCPILEKCLFFYNKPCVETPEILRLSLDLINRLEAEVSNYLSVANKQQSLSMKRHFEIKRLKEMLDATISGQETLQKALAEKNTEIEKQSQNFKVLVSDHRTLQQSFDNLKGLYEDEKLKVEKAKEKCIYFIKKLQKAEAETDRVTALAAEWKDAAYTYADSIDRVETEAIKEFAEKLKKELINCPKIDIGGYTYFPIGFSCIDNLVKEMVGDAE